MARSVKVNFTLNMVNAGTQMLFPLLTFPYACRVIMPEGIGQVNFFSSIISYISLFTCLGIPMYAIREVARVRDDIVKMNRTVAEILLLHMMLTVLGYLAVAVISLTVPQVKECVPLFLILSLNILFGAMGCEWFYQGIEDFLYITIRGLVVKVVSVILLFVLVRTKDDLLYYGWYSVLGAVGGNIFNFFRLRKYVHRENIVWRSLNIRRHIKPVLHVFSFNVVTSLYLQLNPVLLGFMKGALAVGFFAAATKIKTMLMKLSTVLGSVMMPRAANLVAGHKSEEFNRLIQKSYDFTIAFTLPISAGLICCAPSLIRVFCGAEFAPAILTSQIIAPVFFLVGMSNVMGIQVLYPIGKLNVVITCCLIGAITDLVVCLLLIPGLSYNGTAIAYLIAEIATTVSMCIITRNYMPIALFKRQHLKYYSSTAIMCLILYGESLLNYNNLSTLLIQGFTGILVYGLCLLLMKDELVSEIITMAKKKMRR